jgi:hypothetical protein
MMVRAVFVAFCLLRPVASIAQDGAPTLIPTPNGMIVAPSPNTPPAAARPWEQRGAADLRALDKVNDRSANLTIAVGNSASFGHITITVRACVVRQPDQPADAAAQLDVVDDNPDTPAFHGWMFANEPSVSMLQHPVYDIRVAGCH